MSEQLQTTQVQAQAHRGRARIRAWIWTWCKHCMVRTPHLFLDPGLLCWECRPLAIDAPPAQTISTELETLPL